MLHSDLSFMEDWRHLLIVYPFFYFHIMHERWPGVVLNFRSNLDYYSCELSFPHRCPLDNIAVKCYSNYSSY